MLPPDVLTGFLPPENGTGRGEGYVSYVISPNPGLPTGTQIRNVAVITFDSNAPISTDQVSETDPTQGVNTTKQDLVTIDDVPPTSLVAPLAASTTSSTFTVSWSGVDDSGGSGLASYTIFVSIDGGPYKVWLLNTTQTSAVYTARSGTHTYSFISQAKDNVGNVEAFHTTADTTIKVGSNPPTVTDVLVAGTGSSTPT